MLKERMISARSALSWTSTASAMAGAPTAKAARRAMSNSRRGEGESVRLSTPA
jgi:hypothetical protein